MMLMIKLLLLIGAGVGVGYLLKTDPGYAAVAYGDWAYEMPLWFMLVTVLLGFWLFHVLLNAIGWLTHVPAFIGEWWQSRKLKQELLYYRDAYLAEAEQDWTQSAKLFSHSSSLASFIGRIKAAHHAGDRAKRDTLIGEARREFKDAFLIDFIEAKLKLDDGELQNAKAKLIELQEQAPNHHGILSSLKTVYEKAERYHALEALLPMLKANRLLTRDAFDIAYADAFANQAKQAEDAKTVQATFSRVPRRLYTNADMMLSFTTAMKRLNIADEAAKVAELGLRHPFSAKLLDMYGHIKHSEPQKAKKKILALQKKHPENPDFLVALARLSLSCQEWGQARAFYEEALAKAPQSDAFYELA